MVSDTVVQFIGLYVLITSIVYLLRREEFIAFAYDFAETRELRYIAAFFELAGGLAIVLFAAGWTTVYEVIITVFGGVMIVESIGLLIASDEHVKQLIAFMDHDWYLIGAGIIAALIGIYLTAAGFGLV